MRFRRHRADPPDHPSMPDADGPDPVAGAVDVGSATGVGGRADNQDRCFVATDVAIVSDGMGGYRGGATAAELSIDAVRAALADPQHPVIDQLVGAFDRANVAVRAAREHDVRLGQMGATLTVAVAIEARPDASRWLVAHVGDSPAHVVTSAATTPVTVDHNQAAELVAAGVLTEDGATTHPGRHLLMRAIGPDPNVDVDVTEVALGPGDALVLASDGLSGPVGVDEVGAVVRAAPSAASAAATLVATAVERGARDNVTVVVVRQVPSSTA